MKKRLKTLEQMVSELGFEKRSDGTYHNDNDRFFIIKGMFENFGKEHEVIEYGKDTYRIKGQTEDISYSEHWFEPVFDDFLDDEDFEI